MAVACRDPRWVGDVRAGWGTSWREFADGTYECQRDPLCRHHHWCKQAEGWLLKQPRPGVLIWHTPAGRTYATTPPGYQM